MFMIMHRSEEHLLLEFPQISSQYGEELPDTVVQHVFIAIIKSDATLCFALNSIKMYFQYSKTFNLPGAAALSSRTSTCNTLHIGVIFKKYGC